MTDNITPAPGTPTQVAHPVRTMIRSVAQNVISAVLVLGVVLPSILAIFQEELGHYLPEGTMLWLVGVVGLIVAISTALTKIMALPALQPWLAKIGLGTGVEDERSHG